MAKSEVEELTRKTLESGGLLVKLYFDMQSEKAEDLQPVMTDLVSNKLLKAPGVIYCVGEIEEPIKLGDKYSTSAAVTALMKDLGALINVTFNYVPVGVEVLKPDKEFVLKTAQLQSVLVDISQVAMQYSEYILSRVMTSEDYEKIKKDFENRELVGKKLLEKKEGK
ncbi:MAG: hypothetical protein KGH61_00620 [Candidatus Micrarchaeota archaeon]|nr:hypothetical protein [Candidatus Micrarchaeota archaeon]MDE1847439.1 hypothetical protein [Candidatus Micrarchaeota archaeon]MDE1864066.1 hypothetical protein [Candidatus Micrarchaeota archaeon]